MFKNQKQLLEFIISFNKQKKYAPSIREIMEELNLKSTSSCHDMLQRYKKHGLIDFNNGEPRTITVTSKGINSLKGE